MRRYGLNPFRAGTSFSQNFPSDRKCTVFPKASSFIMYWIIDTRTRRTWYWCIPVRSAMHAIISVEMIFGLAISTLRIGLGGLLDGIRGGFRDAE